MANSVPVRPSDEVLDKIKNALSSEGALSHDEIVEITDIESPTVQRALNELWRDSTVYHTLDRKFALQTSSLE